MSESQFTVSKYEIPVAHVREYHRGARSPVAALKLQLSVKRYTPRNQEPLLNAVTVIATHANGFPKETYEPLWDSLIRQLPRGTIRSIWMADCAHQNASAVLNEGLLGDDPNWFDHSRDLLNLINQFATEMPLPLIGIGHSMGCAQLLHLSNFHPRLIYGLALVEPVVQYAAPPGPNSAMASSYRSDWWPSKAAAEESLRTSKFFKNWSEPALQKLIEYGFRDTPTEVYPQGDVKSPGSVTLATSKAQEAWSFVRGHFHKIGNEETERRASPDTDPDTRLHLFSRPEALQVNRELPSVRPNVLYVFGEKSMVNLPPLRTDKMERTGTGVNGNGGMAAGNVEEVTIKGGVHMIPMERTEDVASLLARWLEKQMTKYAEAEQWHNNHDRGVSEDGTGVLLSKQWMEKVRQKECSKRATDVKL